MLPPEENTQDISNSERNFLLLMQMFLEYHCKLYDICWGCGNSNVKALTLEDEIKGDFSKFSGILKKRRYTVSNFVKWHYQCSCNEFWVKTHCTKENKNHDLIKHRLNYSATEIATNPWYVKCPKCGDLGKNKNNSNTSKQGDNTYLGNMNNE